MKKIIIVFALVFGFMTCAFAQYVYHGPTIKHRDDITTADSWFTNSQHESRDGSVELKGYNSVRIDVNVTGDSVSIIGNLACSNDSIWVSGDSLTFTQDSYVDEYLQGCADYYFNIDTVSTSDRITVYLTPFNR